MSYAGDPRWPERGTARRDLAEALHVQLCRPPTLAHHREPEPACIRALYIVDDRVGDLDKLLTGIEEATREIEASTARADARRARIEEALGIIPPAIPGELAQP